MQGRGACRKRLMHHCWGVAMAASFFTVLVQKNCKDCNTLGFFPPCNIEDIIRISLNNSYQLLWLLLLPHLLEIFCLRLFLLDGKYGTVTSMAQDRFCSDFLRDLKAAQFNSTVGLQHTFSEKSRNIWLVACSFHYSLGLVVLS